MKQWADTHDRTQVLLESAAIGALIGGVGAAVSFLSPQAALFLVANGAFLSAMQILQANEILSISPNPCAKFMRDSGILSLLVSVIGAGTTISGGSTGGTSLPNVSGVGVLTQSYSYALSTGYATSTAVSIVASTEIGILYATTGSNESNSDGSSNPPDLSKAKSRLRTIFKEHPSKSGQCVQCATKAADAIDSAYPDYDIDIIRIENQLYEKPDGTLYSGANLEAKGADGRYFSIAQDPDTLRAFHELVRIKADDGWWVIDSLVSEHQGIKAMRLGNYFQLFKYPEDMMITGAR